MEFWDQSRQSVVAGSVSRKGDERFEWAIDDFLSVTWKVYSEAYKPNNWSNTIKSPYFSFEDWNCHMEVTLEREQNRVFLSVRTKRPNRYEIVNRIKKLIQPPQLIIKLGMETGYNGKYESRSGKTNDLGMFCVSKWMTCSEMMERRSEILSNGRLTIYCALKILVSERNEPKQIPEPIESSEKDAAEDEDSDSDSDAEEWIPTSKTVKKMQEDLKSLLNNKEDSDVTIKVQGKEFPAHRNILRVRSPVFKSMFSHEMVEKQSGVVVIDDCDPDTFPDFLDYIYTGSTKCIRVKNVFSLYTASDKYGIDELKEECMLFMKKKLSVGTFCDVITLALKHSENELIALATEFFCENTTEIIKTSKWQTFLHENSTVGNELFIKALSRGKTI